MVQILKEDGENEPRKKSVAQAKINLVEFIDESNVRPTKNGER